MNIGQQSKNVKARRQAGKAMTNLRGLPPGSGSAPTRRVPSKRTVGQLSHKFYDPVTGRRKSK